MTYTKEIRGWRFEFDLRREKSISLGILLYSDWKEREVAVILAIGPISIGLGVGR